MAISLRIARTKYCQLILDLWSLFAWISGECWWTRHPLKVLNECLIHLLENFEIRIFWMLNESLMRCKRCISFSYTTREHMNYEQWTRTPALVTLRFIYVRRKVLSMSSYHYSGIIMRSMYNFVTENFSKRLMIGYWWTLARKTIPFWVCFEKMIRALIITMAQFIFSAIEKMNSNSIDR